MKHLVPFALIVVIAGAGSAETGFAATGLAAPGLAAQRLAATTSTPEATRPADDVVKRRTVAEGHLKFLYAMYFAVKGCTEAAHELSKPELLPSVSLDEVRRITGHADAAAREVGVDVDRAWIEASPIGQATGEALKKDTPDNLQKCRQTGTFVRSILAQLQLSLTGLGSHRSIIEKDF